MHLSKNSVNHWKFWKVSYLKLANETGLYFVATNYIQRHRMAQHEHMNLMICIRTKIKEKNVM